jgi:hypothetical protein
VPFFWVGFWTFFSSRFFDLRGISVDQGNFRSPKRKTLKMSGHVHARKPQKLGAVPVVVNYREAGSVSCICIAFAFFIEGLPQLWPFLFSSQLGRFLCLGCLWVFLGSTAGIIFCGGGHFGALGPREAHFSPEASK